MTQADLVTGLDAALTALADTARRLEGIAAACERAYLLSLRDNDRQMLSGEFPFTLGYVWAQTNQALEHVRKVTGDVDDGREAANKRAFASLQAFRRALHSEFGE